MVRKTPPCSVMDRFIDKSQRRLDDGKDKQLMEELRLRCFVRGPTGILELARALRMNDTSEDKTFTCEDFKNVIWTLGLDCKNDRLLQMFESLDEDGDGRVSIVELLRKLRPPMTESRAAIIDRAFQKVDCKRMGSVTMSTLARAYSAKLNTKFLSGEMAESDVKENFIRNFKACNGAMTQEDFVNYYATVSAAIDDSAYFDLLVRHEFNL